LVGDKRIMSVRATVTFAVERRVVGWTGRPDVAKEANTVTALLRAATEDGRLIRS
jgi:hypothetical protein